LPKRQRKAAKKKTSGAEEGRGFSAASATRHEKAAEVA
jgi:hypothetical protein